MVIRMTWIGLVRKNLMRRPMRTLLTAAGVAIGVGLIVALLSISEGAKRTAGDLIHIGRSDFGLFQSGVSDATRSLLPVSLEKRIDADPGVAESAGVFLLVTKVQGMDSSLVFGLAPNEFPLQRMTLVTGDRSGRARRRRRREDIPRPSRIDDRRERAPLPRLRHLPLRRPVRGSGRRAAAGDGATAREPPRRGDDARGDGEARADAADRRDAAREALTESRRSSSRGRR